MATLRACIKKAGKALDAGDAESITTIRDQYLKDGLDADAAASAAVAEYLAGLREEAIDLQAQVVERGGDITPAFANLGLAEFLTPLPSDTDPIDITPDDIEKRTYRNEPRAQAVEDQYAVIVARHINVGVPRGTAERMGEEFRTAAHAGLADAEAGIAFDDAMHKDTRDGEIGYDFGYRLKTRTDLEPAPAADFTAPKAPSEPAIVAATAGLKAKELQAVVTKLGGKKGKVEENRKFIASLAQLVARVEAGLPEIDAAFDANSSTPVQDLDADTKALIRDLKNEVQLKMKVDGNPKRPFKPGTGYMEWIGALKGFVDAKNAVFAESMPATQEGKPGDADDIRYAIGLLHMDIDALDQGTYEGKYGSNFEAVEPDAEMIEGTKELIRGDIAALEAQLAAVAPGDLVAPAVDTTTGAGAGPAQPAPPVPPQTEGRAAPGGEIGVNGFMYKGGQFLPSTNAPPGSWRVTVDGKRKTVKSRGELVSPGVREQNPTPSSRPIFTVLQNFVNVDEAGVMSIKTDIPEALEHYAPGGIQQMASARVTNKRIEIPMQEFVDMYNNGVRWVAVDPELDTEAMGDAAPAAAAETIDDFGEKIGGARKDVWTRSVGAELPAEYKDITMSKHFPKINHQELIDAGADPRSLALVQAMRDTVPAKPRQKYKVARWGEQVAFLKGFADRIISGKYSAAELFEWMNTDEHQALHDKLLEATDLYMELGFPAITDLRGYKLRLAHYNLYRGQENVDKWEVVPKSAARTFGRMGGVQSFDTREEALAKLKEILETTLETKAGKVRLDLYRNRLTKKIIIGKKVGARKYIDLKQFDDAKEARAYLAENEEALLDLLTKRKTVPSMRRERNEDRIGKDHRNGRNITPEEFSSAFGFRGVEFGNWVEGSKRQENLNDAFDALMDLSALVGISPAAISLNGTLGLAFGARGKGGKTPAAAHYESERVVINLTKKQGAGSLAHEWWHALDNYFAKKRETDYISNNPKQRIRDGQLETSVRPEVLEAWHAVMLSINDSKMRERSKILDTRKTKDYWNTAIELSARAFERFIIDSSDALNEKTDYLANIVSEKFWAADEAITQGFATGEFDVDAEVVETYPYPTDAEAPLINAAYQQLFDTIDEQHAPDGPMLFSLDSPPEFAGPVYDAGAPTANAGMSQAAVEDAIREQMKAVSVATGLRVNVLHTNLWPTEILEQIPAGKVAKGAIKDGVIYLAPNAMNSAQEAQKAFAHEVVGHLGVDEVVGDRWSEVIDNYRAMKKAYSPAYADIFDEVYERYGSVDELREVKEFIAVASERRAIAGPIAKFLDSVRVLINQGLRRLGFKVVFGVSDINQLLAKSERHLANTQPISAGFEVNAGEDPPMQPGLFDDIEQINITELPQLPGDAKEQALIRTYHTRVESVGVQQVDLPVSAVTSPEDAAAIANMILGRKAQEQAIAIVVDDAGNVKEILRHSIGTVDRSLIDMPSFLGAMLDVEGGTQVYIAHNHPSGSADQSPSDNKITDTAALILEDTHLAVQGMLVVTPTLEATFHEPDSSLPSGFPIKPTEPGAGVQVSVTEREVAQTTNQPMLTDSTQTTTFAAKEQLGNGLLLLSNRNRPVGFISMTAKQMKELRSPIDDELTGVENLLMAFHATGGNGAMIVHDVNMDPEAIENLANFLADNAFNDVRHMDNIEVSSTWRSGLTTGTFYHGKSSDEYFSLEDEYSPDEIAVIEHGGFGLQRRKKQFRDRWDEIRSNAFVRFRQYWLDSYAAIRAFSGSTAAWKKAHLAASSWGAIEAALNDGQLSMHADGVIDVDESQKALKEILAPLGVDVDRFMYWIAGNRANRLKGEERENLFNEAQIQILMDMALDGTRGEPGFRPGRQRLFEEVRAEFEAFGDGIVQIAVDTGLVNAEEADAWKEEGFYLPFYRVLSEEDTAAQGPKVMGNVGLAKQQAFKRLKGGTQQLDDLLGNAMLNWNHLISASLKNQAARDALESASQIIDANGEALAVQVNKHTKSKNAFYVRVDGKEQWWELADTSEGKLMLEALTALGWEGFNGRFAKGARKFKRAFTRGVTASPEFKAANLMRDTIQAIAVADMSTNIGKNLAAGWKATGKNSPHRAQMLASGATFGHSGYIHGGDPEAIRYLVKKGVERDTILDTRMGIKRAWDKYEDFGARLENVNRAANYVQMLENGGSRLDAAFEARDHLDFSRHGAGFFARVLASTISFVNARMQGLDKNFRAAWDTDVRTTGDRNMFNSTSRRQWTTVIGAYSALSVLLYLYMKDDEDYQAAEQWERDAYHLIKLPGTDVMIRIPRPFEVGAIANVVERLAEQMADDKVNGALFAERLWHSITETLALNPLSVQMLWPGMEVWANKNTFTDRPIESMGMERLSPTERSRAWTSETAIALSKGMDNVSWGQVVLSPVQIEHLVNGYLGWAGATALAATDMLITRPLTGAPEQPTMKFTDYPLAKRFIRPDVDRNTKYTTEFYETLGEINQMWADIRNARSLGQLDKARALLEKNRDQVKLRKFYNNNADKLSKINKRMQVVHVSKDLSAQHKRNELDRLQLMKNALTKGAMDKLRKAGNE